MSVIQQSSKELYASYVDHMQKIADVKYAAALLQWDQETYQPPKGAAARARQLATLSETAHSMFINEKLGALLQQLSNANDLDFKQQKNVALTLEDYNKQKKYDGAFVRKMSETVSESFYAWMEARKQNNFDVFEPALSKLVELKKQETHILGFSDHPYNALLHEYEKSASVAMLDAVFANVTAPLKELIATIESKEKVDDSFLHQHYAKDTQWKWGLYLIQQLGFDMEAGRQDISEHPFTVNFSAKDVRVTTRIDENDFANMTWSCIHETGHALYEQGLPDEDYGLPSGEYASLSIHESQSRLWENCVGRSLNFWQYYYPVLQEYFPEQLASISLEHFYKAINKVQASFIRTEADELTYHFHVTTRYQVEKEIIEGSLAVKDIRERWNGLYKANLGVDVPDDKRGCIQDVHWSHGSFGYFATYSLGSFYAAQFWRTANNEKPDLGEAIRKGDSNMLLQWLRENIHAKGRLYTSEELCEQVTGEKLNINYFIDYIKEKYLQMF